MKSRHSARFQLRSQCGFTLVEILVTLVVLSIGLLGVASMQLSGLRQSKGSLQATQATAFAYALVDMMRANKTGAPNYALSSFISLPAPSKNCASTACSAAELASFDTYYWFNDYTFTDTASITVPGVLKVLGQSADATVLCQDGGACGSTAIYRVVVYWDQTRGQSAAPSDKSCGTTGHYDPGNSDQFACVVISAQL